jgi:magnesium-transporting ATPase (P-type)
VTFPAYDIYSLRLRLRKYGKRTESHWTKSHKTPRTESHTTKSHKKKSMVWNCFLIFFFLFCLFVFIFLFVLFYHLHSPNSYVKILKILTILRLLFSFFLNVPFRTYDVFSTMTSKYASRYISCMRCLMKETGLQ